MIGTLKQKLRQFVRHYQASNLPGATWCLLDSLGNREVLRRLKFDGTPVWVRTNTPDIDVAISSLHEKEYGGIRCTTPEFIIDAGANIGTSAIYFAQKFPAAWILAVEPEQQNFELLRRNSADYPNITAVKAAIWGSSGARTVHNRFTGHWGFTVSDTDQPTESTGQEIDCVTIDALMQRYEIDRIDLLKLDIEGGEKDVLENSSSWIDAIGILTAELHEEIVAGCEQAFRQATSGFESFEQHGEKITAYRTGEGF